MMIMMTNPYKLHTHFYWSGWILYCFDFTPNNIESEDLDVWCVDVACVQKAVWRIYSDRLDTKFILFSKQIYTEAGNIGQIQQINNKNSLPRERERASIMQFGQYTQLNRYQCGTMIQRKFISFRRLINFHCIWSALIIILLICLLEAWRKQLLVANFSKEPEQIHSRILSLSPIVVFFLFATESKNLIRC